MAFNLDKTALVLGAGASRPYYFPTAGELKQIIIGNCGTGDFGALSNVQFRRRNGTIAAHFGDLQLPPEERVLVGKLRNDFEASDLYSIDSFVFYQKRYEVLARAYIALVLRICEKRSMDPNQGKRLLGDWYQQLWANVILQGHKKDFSKLDIITFNYDRSLEFYLQEVATRTFRDPPRAKSVLEKVNIVHVYGSLGRCEGAGNIVDYGAENVETAADNIKLISPRTEDQDRIDKILASKDRIIFLGFGFDELNIQALGLTAQNKNKGAKIFASCFGLDRPLQSLAEDYMGEITWGSPQHPILDFIRYSEAFARNPKSPVKRTRSV